MATKQELNNYYHQLYHQDLPSSTLSKWVKTGQIKAEKQSNGTYNYDWESFKAKAESAAKSIRATKEKPENYIGKIHGKLLITGIVPPEEKKENYKGTLMYCDCLACGRKHIQVRFSYLTPNGNYSQVTCGCGRKIRAFMASCQIKNLDEDWLFSFDDFEKFLLIHHSLQMASGITLTRLSLQDYKNMIEYFYNDNQFNKIYNFWKHHKKEEATFYDWAKPSLDHIIPKSKGGKNELSNFQFLTVFENLAKRDMSMEEWNNFKSKTHTTSDYFIESIMRN